MLIRFSVGNFLSFNKTQEFSMIGGKVRSKSEHLSKCEKINILKLAAVFGANGSGKSNLVNSMKFAQAAILNEIPPDSINDYFRLNEINKDIPSKFEFEIKIGSKYYAYGFEIIVNSRSIVEEWLYEIGLNTAEKEIFVRDINKQEMRFGNSFDSNSLAILRTYADSLESNDSVLFLTEMNRNKEGIYKKNSSLCIFSEIYLWFREKLIINHPNMSISHFSYFMDEKRRDETNRLISSLGIGIKCFRVVDENPENIKNFIPKKVLDNILEDFVRGISAVKKKDPELKEGMGVMVREGHNFFFIKLNPDNNEFKIQKLQFEHEKEGIWFELYEESDGTRRMLDLIELIFAANSGSKNVYVIDEIDRSLHPQLTYKLIESYLKLVDKSELQLIVTTHEAHILDLKMLRRDEIWFVDKNNNGESSLYSLDQYNERFDKKIDKAYLDGRYGGVPLFDEIFPVKVEN